MGGCGSGPRRAMGKKRTVESCGAISTSILRRLGLLVPGQHFEELELSRPDCGGMSLDVGVHLDVGAETGTLGLVYELDSRSGAFQPVKPAGSKSGRSRAGGRPRKGEPDVVQPKERVDYQIQLVATGCNFGGLRWWFLCPLRRKGVNCGRRVEKLFLPSKGFVIPPRYFGCRHCHELTYASTQTSDRRVFAAVRSGVDLIKLAGIYGKSLSGLDFSLKLIRHQQRLINKSRDQLDG
jgi:hypothetical protein